MGIIAATNLEINENEQLGMRAPLDKVLDFANRVRNAGGGEFLEGLIPAVPNDPKSCLIAKALNFDCAVTGGSEIVSEDPYVWADDHTYAWFMFPSDQQLVDTIAEATGLKALDVLDHNYDQLRAILLPKDIGLVASAFDTADEDENIFPELHQYIDNHPRF